MRTQRSSPPRRTRWTRRIFSVLFLFAVIPLHAQFGNKATRPSVVAPQGEVRKVILKHCTMCHGIDDYAYNALDRTGWLALLDAKHDQKFATMLSAADRDVLLDWLTVKFGPKTKPFPRAYVPPEITTYYSDGEANALTARACTGCHAIDRVNDARFSPDRWRVVTVDMRERGAKITDEELEKLVEWLGRTKGTNPNQ